MIIVTNTMKTEQKKTSSKPGPKGIKRVMKAFRFPADIARKLKDAAAQETLPEATIVQLALRDWFRKNQIE